ncbi:hypothetical protein EJ08DRAFT_682911 [Tothia fuscella]|uniref:Uncharacterized protein n=1 Tax=Tothia fuscella TaxID=1048955 RepID=A0A9P4TUC1_9PEZI|nr:hypothetical protein EJ08DRAFT_682911 [Tothia fuscella]
MRFHRAEPRDSNNQKVLEQWISFNSFASRLLGRGVIDWYDFGIWAIEDCLEMRAELSRLPYRVTVVSQWMEHSSAALAEVMRGGDEKISLNRWRYWKRLLERMVLNSGLDEEGKATAIRTADLMGTELKNVQNGTET